MHFCPHIHLLPRATFFQRNRLRIEAGLLVVGIIGAIVLHSVEGGDRLLVWPDAWAYLGIFIAGILYSSMFTVAFSLLAFAGYAETMHPAVIAVIGGAGSVIGDATLFSFVRDELGTTLAHWVRHFRWKNLLRRLLGRPHVRRSFLIAAGCLVVASPLPDEVGILLLSSTRLSLRTFAALALPLNGIAIFLIASIDAVL